MANYTKQVKTRIMHKHKLEVEWEHEVNKNFKPKAGELIIYDPEMDNTTGEPYDTNSEITIVTDTSTSPPTIEKIKALPSNRKTPYTVPRVKVGDGIHTVIELGFVGVNLEETILCCGDSKNCDWH